MDLERLARKVIFTPSSKKARQGLAGKAAYTHWLDRTRSLLKSIPELREPSAMLRHCLARNGGVLPVGLDATLPGLNGDLWYDPLKRWASDTDDWMKRKDLLLTRDKSRLSTNSTLRTVLRACEGEEMMPKFPVTTLPNAGPDGIRRNTGETAGGNELPGEDPRQVRRRPLVPMPLRLQRGRRRSSFPPSVRGDGRGKARDDGADRSVLLVPHKTGGRVAGSHRHRSRERRARHLDPDYRSRRSTRRR